MSYGFRSESSSGIVQIDDSFQNFVLAQEGTASGDFFDIPLVDNFVNVIAMVRVAYNSTFFLKSFDNNINDNPNFEYRIYAKQPLNQQTSGHGIIVNDFNGNRVFDSGVKKLNVEAVHYLNLSDLFSEITYPSVGYRPWVGIGCLETTGFRPSGQPNLPSSIMALGIQQNTNNSVRFFQDRVGLGPFGANAFWGGGTKSIIIGD